VLKLSVTPLLREVSVSPSGTLSGASGIPCASIDELRRAIYLLKRESVLCILENR
jgi:hypothetical protein